MGKTLETLEKYILLTTIFLIPLAIFPLFPNPFGLPKLTILSFGVALVILVKAIQILKKGTMEISTSSFDFPVILLAVAYGVSVLLRTPNKMEAFFVPGSATMILSASLLYLLINQLKESGKRAVKLAVFLSATSFSLVSLIAASGILTRIPQLPAYMRNSNFNLSGANLQATIFLASLAPLGLGLLFSVKDTVKRLFLAVSVIIVVLGLAVTIFNSLPGKPTAPNLVDFATSWAVSVEALKESPILGIGPGNYLTSFNRFRPLTYNQTDNWALRFTSSRNFYLTVLTETGLLGAAAAILLLVAVYRNLQATFIKNKQLKKMDIQTGLILLLILLAIFPATITLTVLVFILLSLATKTHKIVLNLTAQPTNNELERNVYASHFPVILASLPFVIGVIIFFFYASRALAAEATYKRALEALVANQGTQTYNLMRQAIDTNPYVDRYHASYAQVNLALANSMTQNPPEGGLTDQDRTTIAQLIQQAIREAKSTVTLNPQRAGNWELLASTYRAIVPFAQGADSFAIQTYNQAIALDPINPNLRIALGRLHYALGTYDDAIRVFELATLAKPDHANAHYNLAVALREKGQVQRAINEMTIVLSLVNRESDDYELAKRELEALEKKLPTEETEATESLTPPQPAQAPAIKPPLELPEEAGPPEAPGKATLSLPSPTPTPQ